MEQQPPPTDGSLPLPFCPHCGTSHHELIRTHLINCAPAGTNFTEQEAYDAFLAMHPCYQGPDNTYDQVAALGRFEDLAEQYMQEMEMAEWLESAQPLELDEEALAAVTAFQYLARVLGGDDAAEDYVSEADAEFVEDEEQGEQDRGEQAELKADVAKNGCPQ